MNVILIGMPGVGKSTIGVVLAKTMGLGFLDTDLLIAQREGEILQEIIIKQGMEGFLNKEEQAILSVKGDGLVIATGGSAIYRDHAMEHLKQLGQVIYLKQHYKVIERRIRNIKTRGIAMGPNKTIKDVYWERKVLYEKYADMVIPCRHKSVERIVETIVSNLELFCRNL